MNLRQTIAKAVRNEDTFRHGNVSARWQDSPTAYVVFSYGAPIFVSAKGVTLVSLTTHSVTTARHIQYVRQALPYVTDEMIDNGTVVYTDEWGITDFIERNKPLRTPSDRAGFQPGAIARVVRQQILTPGSVVRVLRQSRYEEQAVEVELVCGSAHPAARKRDTYEMLLHNLEVVLHEGFV